jgi:hypothetical protein
LARAFLITPFSPERAGNEDPIVYERVQAAIREAAQKATVQLIAPMEIRPGGPSSS